MNRPTRIVTAIAGLAFLTALGLGPAPASAQIVPGPCTDCDAHNNRPGQGPGIWHTFHACDVQTGQGSITADFGNNTTKPVPVDIKSTGSGGGVILERFVAVIPAAVNGKAGHLVHTFADTDMNESVTLSGTIGSRLKVPETFNCPCRPPDSSTTVPVPPSSSVPGSSSPSTPPPTGSSPGTTNPARLPETGGGSTLLFVGLVILAIGGFLVFVRRTLHEDVSDL